MNLISSEVQRADKDGLDDGVISAASVVDA